MSILFWFGVSFKNFFRHPLTLQATLAARNPDNVAFISDAVALPDPGKRTTYVGRECESYVVHAAVLLLLLEKL